MAFTFSVEVVLKGRDFAVTHEVSIPQGAPAAWDDGVVREVLVEILRAIDRVEHPDAPLDRAVVLRGFSWIVEPLDGQVVIAIEIPMGAAVAGPFAMPQADLDARIARVLHAERQLVSPQTVH
jgi:hypothetical protein